MILRFEIFRKVLREAKARKISDYPVEEDWNQKYRQDDIPFQSNSDALA